MDPARARALADRRRGIGCDQVILLEPARNGDAQLHMRIFNADGSEAEMCGNGVRCVAKYAFDHGLVDRTEITIETGAGNLPLTMFPNEREHIDKVRVNMGSPRLTRGDLQMVGPADEQVINMALDILDRTFQITCVSMGNPHCVIYVDDLDDFAVKKYGYAIENHELFPRRINVEFVEVITPKEVRQRTWERGAGETLACGTCACAAVVYGRLRGLLDEHVTVRLPGGSLVISWANDSDPVWMRGPATFVFDGAIDLDDVPSIPVDRP